MTDYIWCETFFEPVFIAEQETVAIHENQSIRSDCKMKSDQTYLWAVESDYEWMAVSPEMEPPVDINYTVSLASVVWLRETLVVCD